MTMQQVTGPFADRSPQGAAPRAGQAGFAETTVFDCATGRALARVAVPEGWARSGHVASDYTWTDGFSDAMRGVNTWVRPDGTEVETSTASDRAWTNAAGDVVGGSGGFDPGAGWTELHQR